MKTNRPRSEARSGEFDAIELAAADWLSRQEFGLTPTEAAELQRWLDANPQHARVFRELQETAGIIERHPEALAEGSLVRTPSWRTSASGRGRRVRRAGWLAAAAVIAIGLFLVGRPATRHEKEYELSASTAVGNLRVLALPDGSTVRLNTDSALTVHFTLRERRVKLARGEASFTVAKSASRPFYVEVSGVAVRAVGTEFVVRLRPDAVDILVTEGQVRIEDAAADSLLPRRDSPTERGTVTAEPLLSAGEKVLVPLDNAAPQPAVKLTTVGPTQIAQALAWQERRLIFEGTPLSEVVAEFNRYARHRLVIEDDALGRQEFGGTFRADRYDTLVSLLEQSFDVMAERRGDTTYLRRRSP
jgi:transmembrane sensor